MKPAPPVTSRLRTRHFSEYATQILPPVNWRDAKRRERRTLVENAESRPLRRRRILRSHDGGYLDSCGQQSHGGRLFGNRDREVVPAGNAGIGPVECAGNIRRACEAPEYVGY